MLDGDGAAAYNQDLVDIANRMAEHQFRIGNSNSLLALSLVAIASVVATIPDYIQY